MKGHIPLTAKPFACNERLKENAMIVVLTGAGISRESGLLTFRDQDGLWAGHSVEKVCTPHALADNRQFVLDFYNERRKEFNAPEIRPNAAHIALAKLEEALPPGEVLVVTQNIDTLHEQAGSKNVLHMHGEINKARCERCRAVVDWEGDMRTTDVCPKCEMPGGLRPHIVFFHEVPLAMREIERALQRADLFVSIGTSGVVYPAAGFCAMARGVGAYCVELNLEPSLVNHIFNESRQGPATQVVPQFVEELLQQKKPAAD